MSKPRTWSPQQNEIFSWFKNGKGNLIVRARAGTGKTTTIIEAVEKYAPEKKILLAAFNKIIATELQSRIKNPSVQAKTLHGLGYSYIRSLWGQVTVDADGKRALELAQAVCGPNDPSDAVFLVARVHTKARELQPHLSDVDSIVDLIEHYQELQPNDDLELEDGITIKWIARKASEAMALAKKRTKIIDFADMIFLPLVLNAVKPWFDMVVVDEAQDMSGPQIEMAVKASKGRIVVVGDDRQAIYGFRGADSGSIDRLKQYLQAKELGLTVTYRCPKSVVEVAREFVSDFSAHSSAPEGTIDHCQNIDLVKMAQPGDFILSRTNAPLVSICLSLLKAGKRASVRGRDIGKGILSIVEKQKARDLVSLDKKINAWVARETQRAHNNLSPDAAETRIAYLNDAASVIASVSEDVKTVAELRTKLETLFSDDSGDQKIVCSSTHKAKGLESTNVFLLTGTFTRKEGEERNLLYVAVTRAMSRLIWVSGYEKAS